MNHVDQAIHAKEGDMNLTLASRRLKKWDRLYQVVIMGIFTIGLSGLFLMARFTWSYPDHPVPFSTMAIWEVCILTAFVLAAYANDRVTRRFADKQHGMATEQSVTASC